MSNPTFTHAAYPPTRADPAVADSLHGGRHVVRDPFRALEDVEGAETKAFVAAQQACAAAYLGTPALAARRAELRARLEGYYNYGRSSAPYVRGAHAFVHRNTGLQNQDVIFRLPLAGAAGNAGNAAGGDAAAGSSDDPDAVFAGGEPLLDLNARFPDGTTSLSTHSFSEDGKLWAYALSRGGSDWVTIYVKDVATGVDLPDEVPHVKFSGITWLHDGSGFIYSRYPEAPEVAGEAADSGRAGTETSANAHSFVCFHRLGSPASEDVLVYANPAQPNWRAGVGITDDGRFLYLSTSKGTDPVSRFYYAPMSAWTAWLAAKARPVAVAPGGVPPVQAAAGAGAAADGSTYEYMPFIRWADNFEAEWDYLTNDGERFYFRTNLGAPRYRVVCADLPAAAPLDEAVCAGRAPPAPGGAAHDINLPERATPPVFEVVPQHAADVLDWATVVAGNVLALCYMRAVVNVLQCRTLPPAAALPALTSAAAGAALLEASSEIPLPAPGTVASFSGRRDQDTVMLKFVSFLHPGSTLRLRFAGAAGRAAWAGGPAVRALEFREPPPASSAALAPAGPAATPVPHPEGAAAGAFASLAPYWETRVAGFKAADFEARQVFVPCPAGKRADGSAAPAGEQVMVPMFLVHRRGLVGAGRPPAAKTLVYAYGGFNISLPPNFSPLRLAWLNDCDGLYCLANIRGGGELGEEWHKAGSGLAKTNCFDDLAACGDYLVREGLASRRRLAVIGGSNGGLLALACALRRPDLFGASVAQVPVAVSGVGEDSTVTLLRHHTCNNNSTPLLPPRLPSLPTQDMIRFHKFTIGSAWRGEYGFSEESEADCANMLSYSPLHNVRAPASAAEQLPSMLITTADHDDRVVPLHSLKMAAMLQAVAGASEHQQRPLLVRIDSKAGHGAGKSTTKVLDEYADVYAFIAHELARDDGVVETTAAEAE